MEIIRRQGSNKKIVALGLIIIFLFGFALSAHAATVTWTGLGSDSLASNPANWSGNSVPQYGDDVIFDSTSKDCTWDLTVTLASLSIKSGYSGKVTKISGVSLTIAKNFVPPTAPSGPTATAISSSQIDLLWTDNSNNETGFKIERKTGAGGTYNQIATVGVNVTNYSDTGLTPGTTYYYRIKAYNSFGDSVYSNEASAITTTAYPPTATTNPATNINGNAATLNATVNPNGMETTVFFEWGTDTTYENSTPVQNIGSGTINVSVSANITGLSPSTTYYYRVVATNAYGTSYGLDVSFITTGGTNVSGTISTDTTWTFAGSPYIITGNILVYGASGPTLTIEPGVEIRFNGFYYLQIGSSTSTGKLLAQGTSSSPIVFTSNKTPKASGDWYGIRFYNHASTESILDYVTVEYGGYGSTYGSIYLSNSSPVIQNSTVRLSKYDGIYISASTGYSAPVIMNSSISDNASEGIYVSGVNVSLESITNTTFSNNNSGSYALDIPVSSTLGSGNIFNNSSGIKLSGTTISASTTWSYQAIPYIITGNISVYGSSEPTLTIEPGVELRFNGLYYLNIGYSSSKGRLIAQGTVSKPIVFTSNKATPAAGDWYGIRFYNHASTESILEYVTVEYGGYTYGGIYISNSSPAISHSMIRSNNNSGINITGDSSPVITLSTISNNAAHGINAAGSGSLAITGSTISDNGAYGIYAGNSVSACSISTTSFTNNGSYAIGIPANVSVGAGNSFSGNGNNNSIELRGGTISINTTWTYQGVPYVVIGNISVYSTTSEPTLTIEPGVELRFNGLYQVYIGYSTYKGRLVARGTSSSPIIFTSNKNPANPGDWYGIRFYNHATTESILEYVTVEYGGYSSGSIYIYNSSPTIKNAIIKYSKSSGIYISGDSSPIIIDSTISNNTTYGIYTNSTGSLTITGSTISNNGTYGVYCTAGGTISNTSFTNNGSYAISLPANFSLGTGNSFSGNGNGIEIRAGTISTDTTWAQGIPYIVTGDIYV